MRIININNKLNPYIHTALIITLLWGLVACSSDNEPTLSITTQPMTSSFIDLNTCDLKNGGAFGTFIDFAIPYQASSGIEIEKITTDWEWPTGSTGTIDDTNFDDTGTTVIYDLCWRFGNNDWVDLTATIVTKQGVISSPSAMRLNRPDGAN